MYALYAALHTRLYVSGDIMCTKPPKTAKIFAPAAHFCLRRRASTTPSITRMLSAVSPPCRPCIPSGLAGGGGICVAPSHRAPRGCQITRAVLSDHQIYIHGTTATAKPKTDPAGPGRHLPSSVTARPNLSACTSTRVRPGPAGVGASLTVRVGFQLLLIWEAFQQRPHLRRVPVTQQCHASIQAGTVD